MMEPEDLWQDLKRFAQQHQRPLLKWLLVSLLFGLVITLLISFVPVVGFAAFVFIPFAAWQFYEHERRRRQP